jgi:hypothetical protein
MLLVIRRIGAIDLNPFPRGGDTTRRERHHVVPGEMQFGRRGNRQPQSDPLDYPIVRQAYDVVQF